MVGAQSMSSLWRSGGAVHLSFYCDCAGLMGLVQSIKLALESGLGLVSVIQLELEFWNRKASRILSPVPDMQVQSYIYIVAITQTTIIC